MTQEEKETLKELCSDLHDFLNVNKELLLKDLCARLPYGLKCQIDIKGDGWHTTKDAILKAIYSDGDVLVQDTKDLGVFHYSDFKPYLRPMSSMTEEEQKQFDDFCVIDEDAWKGNGIIGFTNQAKIMNKAIDWLNAHHFDYRDLIKEGLALEAPEDMYK